jgi:hypothetical protein
LLTAPAVVVGSEAALDDRKKLSTWPYGVLVARLVRPAGLLVDRAWYKSGLAGSMYP